MEFGLGLRTPHYDAVLNEAVNVDFFEVISENFMIDGGKPLYILDAVAERYPVVLHGVSMSLGGVAAPQPEYLRRLADLAKRVNARWVSDHLCWVGDTQRSSFDLLPMPRSDEALDLLTERITRVQDVLQRPLVLENISRYVTLGPDQMGEAEFLNALTRQTGAKLLLDLNNVVVNVRNHAHEAPGGAVALIEQIDRDSVQQFHLAGHTDNGDHLIDTHDAPVSDAVFELYAAAVRHFGPVPTLLERDDNIPPLSELIAELDQARTISATAHATAHAHTTAIPSVVASPSKSALAS